MTHGCAALKPFDDRAPDGGASACAHRQPPLRPSVDAGGILDLTLAIWQTDFGTNSTDDAGQPRYRDIGFDLDNTCTEEGQGPSCQEPPFVPKDHYQDGEKGIDNAFGHAWWKEGAAEVITADASALGTGDPAASPTMLLRVRDYSGGTDDDHVKVDIYYGYGVVPRDDGGSDPVWDGQDQWHTLPESLETLETGGYTLDRPRYFDGDAYVSGGMLVARFEDALSAAAAPTAGPPQLWPVHRMVLAGILSQDDGGLWELQDAVIGSRVAITVALQLTGLLLPYPGSALPICLDPTPYQMSLRNACSFLDIAYGQDSPSSPCNAISTGSLVQAKEARLGDVLADPLQASSLCGPPPTNPCGLGDD